LPFFELGFVLGFVLGFGLGFEPTLRGLTGAGSFRVFGIDMTSTSRAKTGSMAPTGRARAATASTPKLLRTLKGRANEDEAALRRREAKRKAEVT
jgi:hypothetical protein